MDKLTFEQFMTTSYGSEWKCEVIKSFYHIHHCISLQVKEPPEDIKQHLDTLMVIVQAMEHD